MLVQDPGYMLHRVGNHDVVFEASNQDTTSADYNYFGFISAESCWIIQRFHIVGSAIVFAYAAGKDIDDYLTHWHATTGAYQAGTPALTFGRYDEITDNL